jgi:putative zinc finger/helix-turn-helix YgiT family protein
MECVVCGGRATKVKENRVGRYRDEKVTVESEFFRCEKCNEGFFSPEQAGAHNRSVKNEIRKKYGLLAPERIVEIRKKLQLTQAELEELLGTGPKVVVRWESGKVIQGSGQDNILRAIERDPSFVARLRQIQKMRSDEQAQYERKHRSKPNGMVAHAV